MLLIQVFTLVTFLIGNSWSLKDVLNRTPNEYNHGIENNAQNDFHNVNGNHDMVYAERIKRYPTYNNEKLLPSYASTEAPKHYRFGYKTVDERGNIQYRKEQREPSGSVSGKYGFADDSGMYRLVEYKADGSGFRAHINTNQPSISHQNPANVHMNVAEPPANIQETFSPRYKIGSNQKFEGSSQLISHNVPVYQNQLRKGSNRQGKMTRNVDEQNRHVSRGFSKFRDEFDANSKNQDYGFKANQNKNWNVQFRQKMPNSPVSSVLNNVNLAGPRFNQKTNHLEGNFKQANSNSQTYQENYNVNHNDMLSALMTNTNQKSGSNSRHLTSNVQVPVYQGEFDFNSINRFPSYTQRKNQNFGGPIRDINLRSPIFQNKPSAYPNETSGFFRKNNQNIGRTVSSMNHGQLRGNFQDTASKFMSKTNQNLGGRLQTVNHGSETPYDKFNVGNAYEDDRYNGNHQTK